MIEIVASARSTIYVYNSCDSIRFTVESFDTVCDRRVNILNFFSLLQPLNHGRFVFIAKQLINA